MLKQTEIDELKPGHETDKLVAEAIGVDHNDDALFSTDLNDAFWAAEQVGLFGSSPNHAVALYRYGTNGVFFIGQFRKTDDELIDLATANTPAMAVCLAILKLKNVSTE